MSFPLHILKRNPEMFIAKKTFLFCPMLAIFSFVLANEWYLYLAGLFMGMLGGLLKLYFMGDAYTRLFSSVKVFEKTIGVKWTIFKFLFVQLFSFSILAISTTMGYSGIIGAAIGILVVPGIISINSVTEYFKLSRNKFGCR